MKLRFSWKKKKEKLDPPDKPEDDVEEGNRIQ